MATTRNIPSEAKKFRKGGALVFVFALSFIFSVLAVTLMEYSIRELKPRASARFENSLRRHAYSALNAAVAVLEEYREIDGGLYSADQGWREPFADGRFSFEDGTEVYALISDESGKIPISSLTLSDLKNIFELFGETSSDAEEMAGCLWDWMDSDDSASLSGAEESDYDSGSPLPPNRTILSFDELRLIKNVSEKMFDEDGNPTDIYKAFEAVISLESFQKTNLNSASEDVLRTMCSIEGKDYEPEILDAIKGRIGNISDGETWIKSASEISNRGGGVNYPSKSAICISQLLKIEIVVSRGMAEYYLCAYYGDPSNTAKKVGSIGNSGGQNKSSQKTGNSSSSSSVEKEKSQSAKGSSSKSSSRSGGNLKILKILERGK